MPSSIASLLPKPLLLGIAVAMVGTALPAKADIRDFEGNWQNTNRHDRGVIQLTIDRRRDDVYVRVWGNCTPNPCDWGEVRAATYADDTRARLPQDAEVISADFNQGFARRQVIIQSIRGGRLEVEVLTEFTGRDRRTNYYDVDTFERAAGPGRPPGPGPGPGFPPGIGREDCVSFNPNTLSVGLVGGRWSAVDRGNILLSFGNPVEAGLAVAIIKRYRMDQQCFVGRPNPSFTYWLTNHQSPSGTFPGADCIGFNPDRVRIDRRGPNWTMVEGSHSMFSFPNEREAREALAIVQHYRFTQSCFVGRPHPSMSYLTR